MKEEFDRLIYDFLSGSITKEDLHKLNEWIYSDPENQKYLNSRNESGFCLPSIKMYLYTKNKPITDLRNESANIRVLRQER